MTTTLITDYLGRGLASARPASVLIAPGGLALWYSTDTDEVDKWNGSAWVAMAKPRNKGVMLAQFVLGTIVSNGGFDFAYKAPYAGTVTSLDSVAGTGTFTLAVKINGTNITGLAAVAVGSAANTAATGADTFAAGDTISGTISAATGAPTDAVLSLNVTWS